MNIISDALKNLITWTYSPDGEQLPVLLAALSDSDLMIAFTHMKAEPVGRICWAEFGRRAGYFNIKLSTVVMDGKLIVSFDGEGDLTHHGAIIEVKS